jgi:16S rRNA (cytosine967-C5)-methyltransferase
MDTRVAHIALAAIQRSSRERPADQALREELKRQRGLLPGDGREAAQAVFAWFRWRGWLGETADEAALAAAVILQERCDRAPETFPDPELAARAVPAWTDAEVVVTKGWLRSLQRTPKLWLRAPAGQGGELAHRLGSAHPAARLPEARDYLGREDLFRTPEFHDGAFEVQDIHSQAVGHLCGAQPGETWWDACAGEGGKTLHLSNLMANQGLIWASDRAAWRLQRLKQRAGRARVFNYRVAAWDGGSKLPTKTKFDGVLVDAPCSGLGTWHRNPHARWTTTPEDVRELAAVQERLLAHVAPALKPGGRLVYAVCTLTRAETDGVADAFARNFPGFEPLPLANPFEPGGEKQARVWLRPEATDGNGMFIAAWRRAG